MRVLTGKVQRRMKITRENGTWIPRLERLAVVYLFFPFSLLDHTLSLSLSFTPFSYNTLANCILLFFLYLLLQARNLDQNEKFIILVLIGYVIVPEPEFQNYHDPNRPFVNPYDIGEPDQVSSLLLQGT